MAISKRKGSPRPPLLSESAYRQLKEEIIQCRLAPGTEFSEPELCKRYPINKAPLRAALTKLVQEGLIRAIPRHGYVVAPITVKSVQDLYELRLVIEPLVAREAATRIDIGLLKRLNVDPGASKSPNAELRFLQSNREFHMAIARAAGNHKIVTLMDQLMDDMARLIHLGLFSTDWRAGSMEREHSGQAREHASLIAAFEARDPVAAEEAARAHVLSSRDLVLKAILSLDSLTLSSVRALQPA